MQSLLARALAFALPTVTLVAVQHYGTHQPPGPIATSISGSTLVEEDQSPVVKPAIPSIALSGNSTTEMPSNDIGVWTSRHLDDIADESPRKTRSTMLRFVDIEESNRQAMIDTQPRFHDANSVRISNATSNVAKPKPVITKLPPVTDVSKADTRVATVVPADTATATANEPSISSVVESRPVSNVGSDATDLNTPNLDVAEVPARAVDGPSIASPEVETSFDSPTNSFAKTSDPPSIKSVLQNRTGIAATSVAPETQLAVAQMESPMLTSSSAAHSDYSTHVHESSNHAGAASDEEQAADDDAAWQPVDLRKIEVNTSRVVEAETKAYEATKDDKVLAERAIQSGFELVQRRANYSARARFIEAMRIVARSLDEQTYSTRHSAALRRGLQAYDEASDFFPSSRHPDDEVNLYMVVGGHETPILHNAEAANLSPRLCVREYMAYAEQELKKGLGSEPLASQALYGLGRLESAMETTATSSTSVRAHRSLMLHQTALRVDQSNFASANELGVLMARYGQYDNAIAALRHCVTLSPQQPTAWRNLANIYRSIGRIDESRMAEANANRTMAAQPRTPFVATQPRVEWIDVDAFARIQSIDETSTQPAVTQPAATPTNVARAPRPAENTYPTQTANREATRMRFFGR